MTARVARLSPDAQLVLRVAAVGGRRVDARPARRRGRRSTMPAAGGGAARGARRQPHHRPSRQRRRYEFRHALLHEAVYADVLPGERRRYHTRYAEQLTADGPAHAPGRHRGPGPSWPTTGGRPAAVTRRWPPRWRPRPGGRGRVRPARGPPLLRAGAASCGSRTSAPRRSPAAGDDHRLVRSDRGATAAPRRPPARRGRRQPHRRLRSAPWSSRRPPSTSSTPTQTPRRPGSCTSGGHGSSGGPGDEDAAVVEYRAAVGLVPTDAAHRGPGTGAGRLCRRAGTGRHSGRGPPLGRRGGGHRPRRWTRRSTRATPAMPSAWRSRRPATPTAALAELHLARELAERNGDVADVAGTYLHLWRILSEHGRGDEMVALAVDAADFCRAAELEVAAPAPRLPGRRLPAPARPLGRGRGPPPRRRRRRVGAARRRRPGRVRAARRRPGSAGRGRGAPRDGPGPRRPDPRRSHQRPPLPGPHRAGPLARAGPRTRPPRSPTGCA